MGADVSEIERKLAAIFAADVEGYSRLMGLDEVGTLRTLTAYRAIIDGLIAQHRGRVFNTAGDSVLADAVVLQESLLDTPEGKDFAFVGPVPRGSIVDEGAGIGIRKGDTKLKDAFNAAIKAIRADGTYRKINDKYFSFDVYGPEPPS